MAGALSHSINQYLDVTPKIRLRYKTWRSKHGASVLPHIVLLQGRGGVVEQFDAFIEKLTEQGYDVWSFDWRGQGLSTRLMGQKGYIDTYDSYLEDLDHFLNHIVCTNEDSSPVVVIAHSMGCHITLRYCAQHPGKIAAALLLAPMLDIYKGILPHRAIFHVFKALCYLGFEKHYYPQNKDYNVAFISFINNVFTRNAALFTEIRHMFINHPEFITGGVTFGWIRSTLESISILLRPDYLKKITIPIHIMEAGNDRIVNNIDLSRVCSIMDHCSFEIVPEAGHQLLAELPEVQERIMTVLNQLVESTFLVITNYSYPGKLYDRQGLFDSFKHLIKKFRANKNSS